MPPMTIEAETTRSARQDATASFCRYRDHGQIDDLERLVADLQSTMEGLAASMGCRPHAEPEDVVQTAWTRAIRSAQTFHPERGEFGAWFARIVVNETIELRRQAARRHSKRRLFSDEAVDHLRPERDLLRSENCERLRAALADLPSTWAEALRLRYLDECSSPEAGARLGVPSATIRTWTARGIAALREALAGPADSSVA